MNIDPINPIWYVVDGFLIPDKFIITPLETRADTDTSTVHKHMRKAPSSRISMIRLRFTINRN